MREREGLRVRERGQGEREREAEGEREREAKGERERPRVREREAEGVCVREIVRVSLKRVPWQIPQYAKGNSRCWLASGVDIGENLLGSKFQMNLNLLS